MSESRSKSSQPLASKQEKDVTEKRGQGRPHKQPPKEPSEVTLPRPRNHHNSRKERKPRGRPTKLEGEEEEGISQESSEEQ
uniref:High mobility group protein HMG-I/HMG-Y n=1 Tax=Macaca nemestrina TaxID=9545 RepID=A0A2K6C9N3_MACNE